MKAFVSRLALHVSLLAALFCSALQIHAQTDVAQLSGLITDSTGAVVPNANLQIVNQETGISRSIQSDRQGEYTAPALPPGRYRVTVKADGFKTLVTEQVTLSVAEKANVGFQLLVGGADQTVTVDGSGLNSNTSDATVSTVVDRQFVENLPLNGRTFQSLIAATPGVVTTSTGGGQDQGQFSVAGQRAGSNYFLIDGVGADFGASTGIYQVQSTNGGLPALSALGTTSSLVSVDAMQEFRLNSSTYTAEYGRGSGGQVVIQTRSGTNQFHGAAFDFLRNDVFDANDWFANSTGQARAPVRQNDFGFVVGGPMFKDRTFFFLSYEGMRVTQGLFQISDVPTVEARTAAVPSTQIILKAFPLPNGPITGFDQAQLAEYNPDISRLDAWSLRIDQNINSKLNFFARYNFSPSQTLAAYLGWPGSNEYLNKQYIYTATAGLTALLTPRITNDFHINFSRARGSDFGEMTNFGGAVGGPVSTFFSPWQSATTADVYYAISGGRDMNFSPGLNGLNINHQFNLTDSVAMNKGSHLLRFGVDIRRILGTQQPLSSLGIYSWSSVTSEPSMQEVIEGATPDVLEVATDQSHIQQIYWNYGAYAQDTWKISPRLTLTYGVRWDYNPPPKEANGAAYAPYAISEVQDISTATLLPRGSPLWHANWHNFAPRLGAAYQLRDKSETPTTIRAGFGQFYDLGTSPAGLLNNGEGEFPYSVLTPLCLFGTGSYCKGSVPYQGPEPPFVFTQADINGTYMQAFDPHLGLPYTLEWSVSVEQSLSKDQAYTISYVGSAGRNLLRNSNYTSTTPDLPSLQLTRNQGYANYNALNMKYERKLSHGFQALISYVWSHSLDLNSNDVGGGSSENIPADFYKLRQDYGDSDFDVRNAFSAALTYNVPRMKFDNKLLGTVVNGWSIDTVNTIRAGTPFNVLYTPNDPAAFLSGNAEGLSFRPDRVPGQPVYLHPTGAAGGRVLNIDAFSIPATARQGDEGRNDIPGSGLIEMDFGLRRQIDLTERIKLQFRAEAFNILNHPNFGNPLSTIGSCNLGAPCTPQPGFGQSQAMLNESLGANNEYGSSLSSLFQTGGPRSMQVSLKLQF
jgi:hypothetical protein